VLSTLRGECAGTSVTLWTGRMRYKSLAVKGVWIQFHSGCLHGDHGDFIVVVDLLVVAGCTL
jgi:hypothetical protein